VIEVKLFVRTVLRGANVEVSKLGLNETFNAGSVAGATQDSLVVQ
jgi:hypothetical protein